VAAHEITAPDPAGLVAALKIAETILETLYVIPRRQKDTKTGRVNPQPPKPVIKLERKGTKDKTGHALRSQGLDSEEDLKSGAA
jgi:hypothetical protein